MRGDAILFRRPTAATFVGSLRRPVAWLRLVLFREEIWQIEGSAAEQDVVAALAAVSDSGTPLLMTLPKLPFNRRFVGRVREGKIAFKHRTHPALWLIGPGSYFFSGRLHQQDGGVAVSGSYRLRPTLAWMYYAYFAIGAAFLTISLLAILLGAALWSLVAAADSSVLYEGCKMVLISSVFIALGWGHITFECRLDARNRREVRRFLEQAVAGTTGSEPVR